jgi:hypothetical protein
MNIYQKLIEVRKAVPYLQKAAEGQQYKYVSSSQVLSAIRAKMDELELLLIPRVTSKEVSSQTIEYKDKEGNVTKKTTTYFTELCMEFKWVNAENPEETITCGWYGQGVDVAGEKGVGKAMTYAEKYFLLKSFNIATDKDDPDAFQGKLEGGGRPKKYTPKQTPPPTANKPASPDPMQGVVTPKPATEPQRKRLFAMSKKAELTQADLKLLVEQLTGKTSTADLTSEDIQKCFNDLEVIIQAKESREGEEMPNE